MLRLKPTQTFAFAVIVLAVLAFSSAGCREKALQPAPGDTGVYPAGLSPKQASMVLAKVGDYSITLGEYAAALERMDSFDRGRYVSQERRRELLDEMIKVELLAQEAERRGIDKEPATQEALRLVLRDALLRDARKNARGPADFTDEEVRAYYNANREQYMEPERRRVSHLATKDRSKAEQLLVQARSLGDIEAWGRLVLEHSEEYKTKKHAGPVETAGDVGFVGPPGDSRGANPRVPEPLRAAVFDVGVPEAAEESQIVNRVVDDGLGMFHLVRVVGVTKAHARSFEESERSIRIKMAEQEVLASEQNLEVELRKRHPVTIDDAALAEAKTPDKKLFAPPLQQNDSSAGSPNPHPQDTHEDHDHDHDK